MKTAKFFFVWNFIPVPLIRCSFLPKNILGVCLGPLVLLQPSVYEDRGTIEHELTHVKQFYKRAGVIHFLLYVLSAKYRLASEVEAYSNEFQWISRTEQPSFIESSALALSSCYRLKLQAHECRKKIEEFVAKNPKSFT
jgi:hypothetical protein